MALARVVAFENVSSARIEELRNQVAGSDGPPEGVPATELLILHDPTNERSLALVFFDSEEDYAQGDAALGAMDAGETPGHRVSVDKYDVAIRMTQAAV
jgi:hypothetical protein